MKFLIPTQVYDTHALAVAAALNKRGHEAIRWFVADFPDRQTASVIMSNDQSPEMRVHGPRFSETFEDVDVLWFRRPTIPTVPGNIDPEDYPFAMQENCAFYQSVWSLLVDRASWINPYRERRLAKSKLYQLRLARETGLSIPRTLASNEPAVVRAFLAEGNKIYKPFRICEWSNEEGTALLQTAAISPEQVFSDHALQAAVGIYQERIHKKHELRVNYFGGKIIAVQLESQGNSKSALDWRAVAPEELATQAGRFAACRRSQMPSVDGSFGAVIWLHRLDGDTRRRLCLPRSQRDGPVSLDRTGQSRYQDAGYLLRLPDSLGSAAARPGRIGQYLDQYFGQYFFI